MAMLNSLEIGIPDMSMKAGEAVLFSTEGLCGPSQRSPKNSNVADGDPFSTILQSGIRALHINTADRKSAETECSGLQNVKEAPVAFVEGDTFPYAARRETPKDDPEPGPSRLVSLSDSVIFPICIGVEMQCLKQLTGTDVAGSGLSEDRAAVNISLPGQQAVLTQFTDLNRHSLPDLRLDVTESCDVPVMPTIMDVAIRKNPVKLAEQPPVVDPGQATESSGRAFVPSQRAPSFGTNPVRLAVQTPVAESHISLPGQEDVLTQFTDLNGHSLPDLRLEAAESCHVRVMPAIPEVAVGKNPVKLAEQLPVAESGQAAESADSGFVSSRRAPSFGTHPVNVRKENQAGKPEPWILKDVPTAVFSSFRDRFVEAGAPDRFVTYGQENVVVAAAIDDAGNVLPYSTTAPEFIPDDPVMTKKPETTPVAESPGLMDGIFSGLSRRDANQVNDPYLNQAESNVLNFSVFSEGLNAPADDDRPKGGFFESKTTANFQAMFATGGLLKSEQSEEIPLNPTYFRSEAEGRIHLSGTGDAESFVPLSFVSSDPMSPDDIIRVHQFIAHLSSDGFKVPGRVRISLQPESLGSVDVDIRVRGNEIHMLLTADRADVAQALQGQQEQLRSAFDSHHLQLSGLDFQTRENPAAMNNGPGGGPFWQEATREGARGRDRHSEQIVVNEELTPIKESRSQAQTGDRVISLFV